MPSPDVKPAPSPDVKSKKRKAPVLNVAARKKPKPNPGGGSDLSWFNYLLDEVCLVDCVDHLCEKLNPVSADNGLGCVHHAGKRSDATARGARLGFDKSVRPVTREGVPVLPELFFVYHISMLRARKRIPEGAPPALPDALRKVLNKKGPADWDAKWVASHLCHNPRCINVDHLV